ncbi:MAG: MucB/RseB C-terminal domain-containing protein [Ideonella sp.]|nr:MucB/RseB C-terminal domain-containing protein [Ideonella sp.]
MSSAQGHDARAWLMRIHEAALHRNYQGTLVVSNGMNTATSRVQHFSDGGQQVERVDWLDGEVRSMIRHNDVVHTLWPNAKLALVEQREPRAAFPALFSGGDKRVLEWYELHPLGLDRVAGLPVEVVLLKTRDSLRFSQRLWAERRTGLLLRADVVAANGQLLESVSFTEVHIGMRSQAEQALAVLRHLPGYRVIRNQALPTSLAQEGWLLAKLPAGFQEVTCARRSLDALASDSAPVVLQTIFADGLTHVSLFIEPFDPKRHQTEAVTSMGATSTLASRRGDHWVTVVGDVPVETLKKFVSALSRKR